MVLLIGGCNAGDGNPPRQSVAGPSRTPEKIVTETGIEMALIPAGEFLMGDRQGADDEKPAHRVELGAFYMDTCEVTQAAYKGLMGRSPSKFAGPDRPVERVDWYSAVQYCNMRSLREGWQPCYDPETLDCDFGADGYRLPTEAEWEYACRAGGTTQWSFGNDPGRLGKYAWFNGNAAKITHPVKQKHPNSWGLYDMHGNVAEWCNDFISRRYDPSAPRKDPRGPASGEERVLRGGSWAGTDRSCRSAARSSQAPRFADACFGTEICGFRCVRRARDGTPSTEHARGIRRSGLSPSESRSVSPPARRTRPER